VLQVQVILLGSRGAEVPIECGNLHRAGSRQRLLICLKNFLATGDDLIQRGSLRHLILTRQVILRTKLRGILRVVVLQDCGDEKGVSVEAIAAAQDAHMPQSMQGCVIFVFFSKG